MPRKLCARFRTACGKHDWSTCRSSPFETVKVATVSCGYGHQPVVVLRQHGDRHRLLRPHVGSHTCVVPLSAPVVHGTQTFLKTHGSNCDSPGRGRTPCTNLMLVPRRWAAAGGNFEIGAGKRPDRTGCTAPPARAGSRTVPVHRRSEAQTAADAGGHWCLGLAEPGLPAQQPPPSEIQMKLAAVRTAEAGSQPPGLLLCRRLFRREPLGRAGPPGEWTGPTLARRVAPGSRPASESRPHLEEGRVRRKTAGRREHRCGGEGGRCTQTPCPPTRRRLSALSPSVRVAV
jgi:hypothetical protein